jgi:hypothetical protein
LKTGDTEELDKLFADELEEVMEELNGVLAG